MKKCRKVDIWCCANSIFLIIALFPIFHSCSQTQNTDTTAIRLQTDTSKLHTGAESIAEYIPLITGKSVGLTVNHTSLVGKEHLVDTLLSLGVKVKIIFAPEHGFRGIASAGEIINDSIDIKTGIPIVSLYGKNKMPTEEQLKEIDFMLFDIQDVGVRFYTYISTMHYVMEACAVERKPLIILDRPNPNGDYVDGMVLDTNFRSFVGMHPIPVVHGLTVGELAQMINGEGWLTAKAKCNLTIIKCKHYNHSKLYSLPVKPSPNLPNDLAIRLYPSLCFFEATVVSIGRGTEFPFQVIGYPDSTAGSFIFSPQSNEGAKHPLLEGKKCYGLDLRNSNVQNERFTLKYFIEFYTKLGLGQKFIDRSKFLTLLAGSDLLEKQIEKGMTEKEIRETWQDDLTKYKNLRKNYLLYPDF